jgi:hypothetical protein
MIGAYKDTNDLGQPKLYGKDWILKYEGLFIISKLYFSDINS